MKPPISCIFCDRKTGLYDIENFRETMYLDGSKCYESQNADRIIYLCGKLTNLKV